MLNDHEKIQMWHLQERIAFGRRLIISCAIIGLVFGLAGFLRVGPWLLWWIIAFLDLAIATGVIVAMWPDLRRLKQLEDLA